MNLGQANLVASSLETGHGVNDSLGSKNIRDFYAGIRLDSICIIWYSQKSRTRILKIVIKRSPSSEFGE